MKRKTWMIAVFVFAFIPACFAAIVNINFIGVTVFSSISSYSPDGDPEEVIIPDFGVGDTTALSVGCWVNGSSGQDRGAVFAHHEGGNQQEWFMSTGRTSASTTDHLKVVVCNDITCNVGSQKNYTFDDASVFDDTWHHIGFVYDGGADTLKGYLDGVEDSTPIKDLDDAFGDGDINKSTADFFIGNFGGQTGFFYTGFIDDCFVDNDTVYSAADFTFIYNSGKPGDISSLNPTGWWLFASDSDHNSIGGVKDASGNNNHGQGINLEAGDLPDTTEFP